MMQPAIFETVLYAEDLSAAERFYHDAVGLEVIQRTDFLLAFRCRGGVLLVFDPRKTAVPGRGLPKHGASGPSHVAFGARPEELEGWRARLREAAIPIESEIEWPEGGRSLYFRDPAGNVVELAPPTLWGGGWKF